MSIGTGFVIAVVMILLTCQLDKRGAWKKAGRFGLWCLCAAEIANGTRKVRSSGWRLLVLTAISCVTFAARPAYAVDCATIQDASERLACFDAAARNIGGQELIGVDEAAAREATKKKLIDPMSAVFGEFTLIAPGFACLTVNAKNRFGGYTGDKEFALTKLATGWYCSDTIEAPLGTRAVWRDYKREYETYKLMSDKDACREVMKGVYEHYMADPKLKAELDASVLPSQ